MCTHICQQARQSARPAVVPRHHSTACRTTAQRPRRRPARVQTAPAPPSVAPAASLATSASTRRHSRSQSLSKRPPPPSVAELRVAPLPRPAQPRERGLVVQPQQRRVPVRLANAPVRLAQLRLQLAAAGRAARRSRHPPAPPSRAAHPAARAGQPRPARLLPLFPPACTCLIWMHNSSRACARRVQCFGPCRTVAPTTHAHVPLWPWHASRHVTPGATSTQLPVQASRALRASSHSFPRSPRSSRVRVHPSPSQKFVKVAATPVHPRACACGGAPKSAAVSQPGAPAPCCC